MNLFPLFSRVPFVLSLQGAIRLNEVAVTVKCRAEDKAIVEAAIPNAVAVYKQRSGKDVAIQLDAANPLAAGPAGNSAANFW